MTSMARWYSLGVVAGALIGVANPLAAQIGGQTAASGDFVIDDFEDLDLAADSLGRNWVLSAVVHAPADLDLAGKGLTLAPGQSPLGAMSIEFSGGIAFTAAGDFGVPMPGTAGVSTDPAAGGHPGNITSFRNLRFVHCAQLTGAQPGTEITFNVLLECYPGNPDNTFPTLLWNYAPARGTVFEQRTIDLYNPSTILNNPDGLTVESLLSQTRFLDFYFIATPVSGSAVLTVHVDDIVLAAEEPTLGSAWILYE